MYIKSLIICSIYVLQCVLSQNAQNLIVTTTQGQVRGVAATDGNYSMYMGIPYGKVIETNPFGPSVPHPSFDGVFEANDDSHFCPQIERFNGTLAGDLNCLRLSVFVPASASTTNKLPVLVWIYGGRFEAGFYGTHLFGPKFLVRHDIILVTINYRLGPYGFMCLDIPEIPGNQGLKDQLLALRWIHENIEAFGGDPDKITVSGNSAGSMSIDFHFLRRNEGPKLIDKAIFQSGTSFSVGYTPPFLDAPIIISEYLDFSTNNRTQALKYLATVEPLTVIQAVNAMGIQGAFRPCVETEFDGVEAFLTNNQVATTLLPTVKDMPIMMGFTNDETYGMASTMGFNFTVEDVLSGRFNTSHEAFAGMGDVMRHFYFGDEMLNKESLQSIADLRSDTTYTYATIRSLERFLRSEAEKVYFFVFSYSGGRNYGQYRRGVSHAHSAWHTDEIAYLFDNAFMEEPTPEDQLMIDRMTTMWTNFVKSGNPTPTTSELLPIKWEPITKDTRRHFLEINTTMSTDVNPFNERMSFWDFFFEVNGWLELQVGTVYVVERTD